MMVVKSVKIDGENIYYFKSAVYIFESASGAILQLDLIVSEITVAKYKKFQNLIIEIDLEDGRNYQLIMFQNSLPGGLPQLNLYCEINDIKEFENIERFSEDDIFPSIEEGITLEEIRKVEMPNEEIRLKLTLPIDLVEWLHKQRRSDLNELFKEMLGEYLKKTEDK